jgi:hypothetical protein
MRLGSDLFQWDEIAFLIGLHNLLEKRLVIVAFVSGGNGLKLRLLKQCYYFFGSFQ